MDFLVDIQAAVWPARPTTPNLIVIHRCDMARKDPGYPDAPAIPSSAAKCADFLEHFKDKRPFRAGAYTGGKFPYSFVVDQAGAVTQVAAIGAVTPHARAYNIEGLGVMCVGDFRRMAPTSAQWSGLTKLCSQLLTLGIGLRGIVGHTSLNGASSDCDKVCPGQHMNLNGLTWASKSTAPPGWGIVL